MFYRIADIGRIGADYARKLEQAGVTTTEHLMAKAHDARARGQLSVQTGIGEKVLAQWVSIAELMRVTGIGRQYGELLLGIGVDSTQKLFTMGPQEVVRRMEAQRQAKQQVGGVPKLLEVEDWLNELRAPAFARKR